MSTRTTQILPKKMDPNKGKTDVVREEVIHNDSPKVSNKKLLPKNCVALVGNTPVVFGQKMLPNNGKTDVVREEVIQNDSPKVSNTTLLPKNCVALVGNTPVVFGQKMLLMGSNSNTQENVSKVHSGTAGSLNKAAKTNLTTAANSSFSQASSHATVKNTTSHPQVAPPGLGASHVMRALACETFRKSAGKDPIILKPLANRGMPGQNPPVKQFRFSGNVSIRHFLSNGIRINAPRKPGTHSAAAVLSPNNAPRKPGSHSAAAVLSPNNAPRKPGSHSAVAVLSPNNAPKKPGSHSAAAVLSPSNAPRKPGSHSAAVLSPNSVLRKPGSHSAAVLSPNNVGLLRKSGSHSAAVPPGNYLRRKRGPYSTAVLSPNSVPRKHRSHSMAVLPPNNVQKRPESHSTAVLPLNNVPKTSESHSVIVLSPNSVPINPGSHSTAVLPSNNVQRNIESHSTAVLPPSNVPKTSEPHSVIVLSPNNAPRKPESHTTAVLSPVIPVRSSTKPQTMFGTSSLTSVNSPKPRMIDETLSDTPKEVPSGSIMVNLQGQAVKIVGLPPALYAQSTTSNIQKTGKPLPKLQPKTSYIQSIYDQKIKALKDKHCVSRKSSLSAVNKPIAPKSQVTGLSLSQMLTSASHGQSQSMIIGNSNLASLTPHSQAYILTNTSQIRTSPNIVKRCETPKIPNSDHPTWSVMTSLGTTTTHKSATLQTILTSPFASKTSGSVNISPNPQISTLTTASHPYLANLAINKSKTTSADEVIDVDQEEKTVSSVNMHFFTSMETCKEGQSVMVVRPVLDSDDDQSNESNAVSEDTKKNDSHADNSLRNTDLDPPIPLSLEAKHGESSKTTTNSYNQNSDSLSDFRIQSVFSLANISSTFDMTDIKESEEASETDSIMTIDADDGDEVTFNIYDNDWKKICPPSYVVLERLYPQDIEDKKIGRNNKVQCSPHCRERTLAYLCELNLMHCEHLPSVKDDPTSSSAEKTDSPTSNATTIDVEEYIEIEKDSSLVSKENSANEVIPESLSAKEINDGIKNMNVESEHPAETPMKDIQNEECQLDTGIQKEEEKGSDHMQNNSKNKTEDTQNEECQLDTNIQKGVEERGSSHMQNNSKNKMEDTQREECQLDPGIQKGVEERGSSHMQNNSNNTNTVIQAVESQGQEDKEPSVMSPKGAPNKLKETKESAQLKSDLISLKRQVEEKRFDMKMQKKLHKLQSKSKVVKRKNTLSEGSKSKVLPKQRSGKLPVVIQGLLKPKTAPSHQSTKHPGAYFKSKSQESLVQKRLPSTSNSSVNNIPASPPTYVLNCSASSIFENSGDNGSQQTVGSPTSSIMSSISPLPLLPNNLPPQAPKSTVKVPLIKVYSALKSLSSQMEKTGHKLEGTQLVMIKAVNAAVVLKVQPEALLPENLEALHKAAFTPTTNSEQSSQVVIPPISTPLTLITADSKVTSSVTNVMNYNSSPSTASSTSRTRTVPSTSTSRVLNKIVPISSTSKDNHKHNQKCSNVPPSSSATSITGMQNIHNPLQRSPIFSSSSSSDRQISLLSSSQSGVHHHRHSSFSLRSLLAKSAYKHNDPRSALTRVPPNSSLLPERRKRPSDYLSEEEKAAKRRKLEAKYPLPPGVIIKTEPDTSEYDIGNDWSVTTDIQTGFIDASEIAGSMTETDASESLSSGTNSTLRAGNKMSSMYAPVEAQQSVVVNVDSNNTAEDDIEITDSPPPLQVPSAMEKDCGVFQEENENETPPVLQPMPSLIARPPLLEEREKASHKRASSVEDRQRKSTLASGENSARTYDSSYDSVSTSSSAESLLPEWTQSEQPVNSAKTKIQKLKELLRQKELQVENMRKKRSEMPEVDLSAL